MKKSVTDPLHRAILAGNAIELHRLLTVAEACDPTHAQDLLLRLEADPWKWRKHGNEPQSVVEAALWAAIVQPSQNQDDVVTVVEHWMAKFLKNPDVGWNQWILRLPVDMQSPSDQFLMLPPWITALGNHPAEDVHKRNAQTLYRRLTVLLAAQPTHTIGYRWLKTPLPNSFCVLPPPLTLVQNYVWNWSSSPTGIWPIPLAMVDHLWTDWIRFRPRQDLLVFDDIAPLLRSAANHLCREVWDKVVAEAPQLMTPDNLATLWTAMRTERGASWLHALVQEKGFHPLDPTPANLNKLFRQSSDAVVQMYLKERWKSLTPTDISEWITLLHRGFEMALPSVVHTRQLWKWTAQTLDRFSGSAASPQQIALNTLDPSVAFEKSSTLHQWLGHLRALHRLTKKEKDRVIPLLNQRFHTPDRPFGIWDALYEVVCRIGIPHNTLSHHSISLRDEWPEKSLKTCLTFLDKYFPLTSIQAHHMRQHWQAYGDQINLSSVAVPAHGVLLSYVENIALSGEVTPFRDSSRKQRL